MSNNTAPTICGRYFLSTYFLTACLIASPVYAGKLDDLEEAASEPTRSTERSGDYSNSRTYETDPDNDFSFIGGLIEITAKVIVGGGINSMQRYSYDDANNESGLYRKQGDPILPTLNLTSQWLNGSNGISAQLNRVELGMGFIGISFTDNTLKERGDTLNLSHTLIHYRMSAGNDFSWDFAFGKGKMNGNQSQQGDIFALPMRLRIAPEMHLEYYPVWSSYNGGQLAEQQFSLNWQRKYVGLSAGFKKWSAGDTSVSGLFTGISVNF